MMIAIRSLSLQTIELSVMYVSVHMKKGIHVSGVNQNNENTEYKQSLIADHRSATVCKGQPNEMDTQGNEQQLIAVDSSSTSHEEHISLT